ncbi:MAG TPA: hypothetical protein VFH54_01180 [Mycobacteriales bacterium]|nr:hypothetical protein [Mycobacteriales bacterium]
MHIDLFGVVLFLHISVAIVAFAMAGVMHTSLQAVARARTVQEVRSWGRVMHRIEPLFPVMALLLLGFGIWLVHLGHRTDDAFSYKDGWVVTAIVALVAVEAVGGAVLAPRGKQFTAMIEQAADGPVADDLHSRAVDPAFWYAAHITTFAFLGVVFLMTAKPDGQWAWLFPTVGAAVGVLLSKLQLDALRSSARGAVPAQREGTEASVEAKA